MRPGILHRTVAQTLPLIKEPDTRLVIAADDDDDGTISLQNVPALMDPRIIWSIEPREDSLGAKYNRVLRIAPADVYCVMTDDCPHVTAGFDTKILETATVYPDGYAVIVNHLANQAFTQMNAVTAKMVAAMDNKIYVEYFPYWFIDHWLEDVAKQIGREVFVDVMLDCNKSNEIGTLDKKEPHFWGTVFNALHVERAMLAQRIINAPDFEETPARKKALLRNQILTFEWSQIINNRLQGDQGQQVLADDVRYHRLKDNVIEKLISMGLAKREPVKQAA